jgi:hypothetical protein
MYEVTVDFHDDAVNAPPKRFESLTDMALYLERIPSMMGFEIHGKATVHISTKYSVKHQTPLPFDGLKA